MLVKVRLYATFKIYARVDGLPGTPFGIELPEGGTLLDAVQELQIPVDEVKITFVNGIARPLDHALNEGDEIGIFPPIGGG